ncbi:MAG: hypothetical protein WCL54_04380 [Clostridia bacterium]
MAEEYSDMVIKAQEMREALDWQVSRTAAIKQKLDGHIKAGVEAKAQVVAKNQGIVHATQIAKMLKKDQSTAVVPELIQQSKTKGKGVKY